jgi:hypothetical protein
MSYTLTTVYSQGPDKKEINLIMQEIQKVGLKVN